MSDKNEVLEFEEEFLEVVQIIQKARCNALKNVNSELINLYWQIGEYISRKVESAAWAGRCGQTCRVFAEDTARPERVQSQGALSDEAIL